MKITQATYAMVVDKMNKMLDINDIVTIPFADSENKFAVYLNDYGYDMYYSTSTRYEIDEWLQSHGLYLDPFYKTTFILCNI